MAKLIDNITREFLYKVAVACDYIDDPRMAELMDMYKRLDYLGDATPDEIEAFDEISDSIDQINSVRGIY